MIEYRFEMATQPAISLDTDQDDVSPSDYAWRGIELCRQGDWQKGFYWLSLAADSRVETSAVPSLFFAYLGYGLARLQGETDEGVRLCRRALELDIYQPENYYYLASALLLTEDRRSAVDVIEQGLQIDATHEGLQSLKTEIGQRRRPVLPFLARDNFLNRSVGRLRHRLFGPPQSG